MTASSWFSRALARMVRAARRLGLHVGISRSDVGSKRGAKAASCRRSPRLIADEMLVCLRRALASILSPMLSIRWLTLLPLVAVAVNAQVGAAPEAEVTNRVLRVRLYLPDAKTGFYRGTRFDWAGVVASAEFAGHDFFPQWFQRSDLNVNDFIYDGADIVAGPCTAVTGPAEEFLSDGKALGFEEATAGGTFVKIGVGVLRRPDEKGYSPFRLYPIADGGQWKVTRRPNALEFTHELADPASGYAYEYRKTVSVPANEPRLVLDHVLRNTGRRVIQTSVYNHNFFYVDRQAPGPDFSLAVPFNIQTGRAPERLVEVRGNRISFARTFTGEDRVFLNISGFGAEAKDYDIRLENRRLATGVRITSDSPLSRMALWAIRAPLSIEPFIAMRIEPGRQFTWRITYEFYSMAQGGK